MVTDEIEKKISQFTNPKMHFQSDRQRPSLLVQPNGVTSIPKFNPSQTKALRGQAKLLVLKDDFLKSCNAVQEMSDAYKKNLENSGMGKIKTALYGNPEQTRV
jgi:hypothetical protein